eukprot:6753853-Prymnesium_polylepis.1
MNQQGAFTRGVDVRKSGTHWRKSKKVALASFPRAVRGLRRVAGDRRRRGGARGARRVDADEGDHERHVEGEQLNMTRPSRLA